MVAFQIGLLAFGVISGLVLAYVLRPQRDRAPRSGTLVAFGAGAVAWIFFAAVCFPAPLSWVFVGTVLALYLPSLIVLVAAGTGQPKVDHDR